MVWPFSKKKVQSRTTSEKATSENVKEGNNSAHFAAQSEALILIQKNSKMRAVKIVQCNCGPSIELMDKVFAFDSDIDIPVIPLPNCHNPNKCRCAYLGVTDRRVLLGRRFAHDRRVDLRIEAAGDGDKVLSKKERRKTIRRASERSAWDKHEKF